MIILLFALALLAQTALVSGQILLKRAVSVGTRPAAAPTPSRSALFALAIACMTLYFFIWLGVAGWLPLSQLAPFDALGPVLLVIWARLALGERLAKGAWLAVLCILAGIAIIAFS